jgi:hypothetical protein
MPDNASDVPPVTPPAAGTPGPSAAPVAKKKAEPLDPAHVPMSEEFDRAKWTLPPVGIVLIGIAIVAIAGGILAYTNRAKPVAAGGINTITSVPMQDNTVMTAVQLNVSNATPKRWYIQSISAKVKTEQGEWSDDAAPAVDSERYFQAFPALGAAGTQVLKFDQKLAPGEHETGTVVFSFPITKEQFDQRKSLTVTITPFDNAPVTFTK